MGWGNREPAHVRTKLNFDVKEEKDSKESQDPTL